MPARVDEHDHPDQAGRVVDALEQEWQVRRGDGRPRPAASAAAANATKNGSRSRRERAGRANVGSAIVLMRPS
jgi:hypothetical protein